MYFSLRRYKNFFVTSERNTEKGASLLEVVIATGVVGLVMTSVVAAMSVSLTSAVLAKSKNAATKYTQEGIEYFRTQRNLMGWESFVEQVQSSSIFCLATLPPASGGGLATVPRRHCNSEEFLDSKAQFQREAEVAHTQANGEDIITITVNVTWQQSGRTLTSNASVELRNVLSAQYDPPKYVPSPILFPSPIPTPIPSPLPSPIPSPSPIPPPLPSGAVIAMNAATCPTGWSEFTQARGRTVVGTNPAAGGGISNRWLGQLGGFETHTLSAAEMPVHAHTARQPYRLNNGTTVGIDGDNVVGGGNGAYGGAPNLYNALPPFTTGTSGSGGAHNNMPPFYILLICRKD